LYRDHFNDTAANEIAQEYRLELSKLDADNPHAVAMGNLDTEGGSVNGRIATGSAVTVQATRIRQERKKKDAELISIIEQLRETLQRINERIDQLAEEIGHLTELRDALWGHFLGSVHRPTS
jgi:hypothetical protein